jgi:hypothetical protein
MSLTLVCCRWRTVDCTILVVESEMDRFRVVSAGDKVVDTLHTAAGAVSLVWEAGSQLSKVEVGRSVDLRRMVFVLMVSRRCYQC